MEALFSQFTFLSNQALQDKNFDPSSIEDARKLFEIKAYSSWAAMEMEHQKELLDAEIRLQEAELALDAVMGGATAEFSRFQKEMDGVPMEKTASVACQKYVPAATNSATASGKAVSSNKVYPF